MSRILTFTQVGLKLSLASTCILMQCIPRTRKITRVVNQKQHRLVIQQDCITDTQHVVRKILQHGIYQLSSHFKSQYLN